MRPTLKLSRSDQLSAEEQGWICFSIISEHESRVDLTPFIVSRTLELRRGKRASVFPSILQLLVRVRS